VDAYSGYRAEYVRAYGSNTHRRSEKIEMSESRCVLFIYVRAVAHDILDRGMVLIDRVGSLGAYAHVRKGPAPLRSRAHGRPEL